MGDTHASFVSETITLDLNEQTTLDITLQVGGVTEAVTVNARRPIVQAQRTELSLIVNEQRTRVRPEMWGMNGGLASADPLALVCARA